MADEDTTVVEEEHVETTEAPAEEPSEDTPAQEENEEAVSLRAALEERDTRIAAREEESGTLREDLAAALQKYRASLLASAPEVPDELVQGDTIQELE